MPSQNMPLKGRTDSGDPAEFRPQRLSAFELRRWEAQLGPSARISAGCLRGRNCRDFPPSGGQSSNTIAHFALDFSRKESVRRGSAAMEFELIDTGLFDFLLRHHRASPDIESVAGCLTQEDRKSTRLNSSHVEISYAVFCLKKKKKKTY